MQVFFDNEGIKKCLCRYKTLEIKELNILSKDYEKHQLKYYKLINNEARKLLQIDFFSIENKDIHCEGRTSFVVEKSLGIHKYRISEASGMLKQLIEGPNSKTYKFYTIFEKLNTSDDIITPSFNDIFFRNKIILKPKFQQKISINLDSFDLHFDHVLAGYTIINLFPYPKFSDTLYFLEVTDIGLVPIAYAVYI